jgi:hypothetical protein
MVSTCAAGVSAFSSMVLLTACSGSGFAVTAAQSSQDAAVTSESGAGESDAGSALDDGSLVADQGLGAPEPVPDGSIVAEGSLAAEGSTVADGSSAAEASTVVDGSPTPDATVHACPSTCAELNANCGAVTDTFCGGLIQCGACTTGVCGGAAPSMCGCPSGQLACATGCTNPMTDSANCGKCGTSCTAASVQGEACVAGACGCPTGTVMCFGQQANYCQVAYKACF